MGHGGEVEAASFSPDGTQIATVASNDDAIRIWDVRENLIKLCRLRFCGAFWLWARVLGCFAAG
jgi:WD40 repeat protein